MSLHKSLVSKSKLKRDRNVLTRAERLLILKKDGRWDEEKSVFGIPKVRVKTKSRKAKGKKVKKEEKPPEEQAAAGKTEKAEESPKPKKP